MAPRVRLDDPSIRDVHLSNVPGKGLGYYDRDGKLVMVADVSLQLLGTAFSATFGLKGQCWAVMYHKSKEPKKVWRVIVPKKLQISFNDFEQIIDRQTRQDSGFRIRKPALWVKFIQQQEDHLADGDKESVRCVRIIFLHRRLHELSSFILATFCFLLLMNYFLRFLIAECTGLQDQSVDWENGGRDSERYVFSSHVMLDCQGKKLRPIDCIFFEYLSFKKECAPLLKPIRFRATARYRNYISNLK